LQKELIQVANVAATWASYLVPGPALSGPQTDAEDGLVAQAPTAANVRLWGAEGAQ
jgi:hypothetical protein